MPEIVIANTLLMILHDFFFTIFRCVFCIWRIFKIVMWHYNK